MTLVKSVFGVVSVCLNGMIIVVPLRYRLSL
jgi:hypothetical protein